MKILLIPDRPGWAYDILAQSIKEHSKFDSIDIQYIIDIRREVGKVDFSGYDVIFVFLWYDAMRYGPQIKGFEFGKTCVGVHSIASWENRNLTTDQASQICNQFAATGYISQEIGRSLKLTNGFFTPNGVEESLFFPSPLDQGGEVRLMWVGNPSTRHHGENKGFHSIVKPVVDSFSNRNVRLVTATPQNPVAREDMGEFYRSHHALICSSRTEGGPMPVVEALACGRPVLSTSVGVVPELVIEGENGLLFHRSRKGLHDAIEALLSSPTLLTKMSKNAPGSVSSRLAHETIKHYDSMFESIHKRQGERS